MNLTLGILAHVDAGKTTFCEAMLYHANSIKSMGRVDHKDAFMDAHPLEKMRGITIFSDQAMFSIEDKQFFVVDTPGHVDFAAEMERSMAVLDYAILMVSCVEGIQAHTETVWRMLRKNHVPTFIFLNKTDRVGADADAMIEQLKRKFSPDCVPAESLAEAVAERDERMLEAYLSGKTTGKSVDECAQRLIAQEQLFLCFRGSALLDEGVQPFLDALGRLTRTHYDAQGAFGARVFRIRHDAQGNRLTFLKIISGQLSVKDGIEMPDATQRVHEIRLYNGAKHTSIKQAQAGQLVAVAGLTNCRIGDALGQCTPLAQPTVMPLLKAKLLYPQGMPPQTVLAAFRKLEAEDPMLGVEWNEQLKEIQICIMGIIQLEVLRALVMERYSFEVDFGQPRIMYRETIAAPVHGAGHYEPLRHYAEVHLRLRPLPRGEGIQFSSSCHVDTLSMQYQNLVRTHVFEKQHVGVLTGSPLADVNIDLIVGRMHLKHTQGGDFREATHRAIRQGLMKADSILLEPYYAFVIQAPQEHVGRIISDIERMHGSFDAPHIDADGVTLAGRGPVATFMQYAQELTAFSKGRGRLATRFDGYEPCHNAQKVIESIAYDAGADKQNDVNSVFCAKGAGFVVHWSKADEWMHCAPWGK